MERIVLSQKLRAEALRQQLQQAGKFFEIQTDYDLEGLHVTLSPESALHFQGGSLNNGTLAGHLHVSASNPYIFGPKLLFDDHTTLSVTALEPEWFGARGDFDPDTHRGTDDTAALQRTINVAEQLKIKIVRFRAVNYLCTGLHVRRGNLWLQGAGAQLREDQWIQGATLTSLIGIEANRNSALYVAPDVSALTFDADVADPVYLSDLQLFCDKTLKKQGRGAPSCGVNFMSAVNAPTWPFLMERCYVRGFHYGFFLNSPLDYPINYLRISDCAFRSNSYCLYAGKATDGTVKKGHMERQCSWDLTFQNNKCHDNGLVLSINVQKGLCLVENNNCEGTRGVEGDRAQQYALDIELGQRAEAVVRYNHFEQNATRPLRVTGSGDCTVVAMNNNTDGLQASVNRNLFRRVVLQTDMSCLIEDCIVACDLVKGKQHLLEGHASAFLTQMGSWILSKEENKPVIFSTLRDVPKVIVDTPFGQKCMGLYFNNGKKVTTVIATSFPYDAKKRYLNIEMPYFRKSENTLFSNIYLRVSYTGGGKTLKSEDVNPHYLYSSHAGFYRLRMQARLSQVSGCTSIYIHMAVYTDESNLGKSGEVYIGSRALLLTSAPLDLNVQLNTQYDMTLTGDADDCLLMQKGQQCVMGVFQVTCLEDGNLLPKATFRRAQGSADVVTTVQPVGSWWTDGRQTFQLTSQAEPIEDFTKVRYKVSGAVDSVKDGGVYTAKRPVLVGHGVGTERDMSSPVVQLLSAGSTFYDSVRKQLFTLSAKGQWLPTS